MVEVLHAGAGKLVCCGVLMKSYVENSNSRLPHIIVFNI